jgi:flagellin-like hook-associated protein FlgL
MFTANQLKINTGKSSKSAEKLSSGYRINRAADDAAGLAISEKMRKQIRGLDRGSENIQDGISVCQIGDGALAEVTEMLQRVRELSIQAYNGTNSDSDRQCIQDEIDQCLDGIDEIRERTKFNDLYVLKGSPATTTLAINEGHYETVTYPVSFTKDKPDWLSVDDKIEPHNYTSITQDNTDPTAIMVTTITEADGKLINVYYGPNQGTISYYGGDATWIGDYDTSMSGFNWTSDITDNPSAKMDFSGLLTATSAVDLYSKMIDMLGVQIEFPCGTCGTNVQGVQYTGAIAGYGIVEVKKNDLLHKETVGVINLSSTPVTMKNAKGDMVTYNGYFDMISNLVNEQKDDPSLTDDQKLAQVKEYAEVIASDLANKTYQILDKETQSHFDRAAMDANDPYSVYIYDYRDRAQLTTLTAADTRDIYTMAKVTATLEREEYIDESYIAKFSGNMTIQASANCSDKIAIELPDISRKTLNLEEYSVTKYTTESSVTYSDSYLEKLRDWEENGYTEQKNVYTKTVTCLEILDEAPIFDENGEFKGMKILDSRTYDKDVEVTEYYRVYDPKPKAEPGDITINSRTYYDPTSLDILDDAIDKVCKARSRFGAQQNRLEHAYNINKNTEENTQAGESRIRDTDMAEEMLTYSANNILMQAGNAFLTQAMQNPQSVLQLLS